MATKHKQAPSQESTLATMIEQETEALAVKLTRIWGVVTPFVVKVTERGVKLIAPVNHDVELRADISAWDTHYYTQYTLHELGPNLAFLVCGDSGPYQTLFTHYWTIPPEDIRQRRNEWLPFFRRSCWLCGCDIEATMHEKMEWVQGFTSEELEAWNLKM